MYKTKTLFVSVMMMSTMMVMSSTSWMGMWMGMEMNMMSFIPLIKKKGSKDSSEAMMIYFLTQSVSSSVMMFSIIMMNMYTSSNNMIDSLLISSLMVKMGAAPFHMWIPEIMTKLSWNTCMVLMTWQKMAPLSVMSNIKTSNIMIISMVMSVIVGSMGGLNQTSLKKIMGYSSINHMGWMISLNKIQSNWMMYMLIYSLMIMMTCTIFKKHNMMFINQINNMEMTMTEKMSIITSMLSLGGMPPLIGFLPKWMAIQTMMKMNMNMTLMVMMLFSLITLFFYMRTMSPFMLTQSKINKWNKSKINKKMMIIILMMNFSLPAVSMINML
uniref:NADH-ubiquinone oxidoreductase chain 2 n=1 Tax=Brachyplatys subaeneus TaxID=355284 RepID=A0A2K9YV13_9HEMI|nr:NADH dehydrogenase subunit 2 [Brachyplatys subaeneus]